LKVLFDALRIPDEDEIRGLKPNPDRVIACLLEDDKLITGFRITNDRLLEPAASESEANNVHIVMNVEVKSTKLTYANMIVD
jgi:hypothetical protein